MKQKRLSQSAHATGFDEYYKTHSPDAVTAHHRIVCQSFPEFQEHCLPKNQDVKTVLDIGCGAGLILEELELRGIQATGTEISSFLLGRSLKRFSVYPYGTEQLESLRSESWDFVFLIDVLNCLRDEEEVDDILEATKSLASTGVMATFGTPSPMSTLVKSTEWFMGKVEEHLGCPASVRYERRGSGVSRHFYLA